jgi:hypothetical protein
MADIFLSYARADTAVASALAESLSDLGWSVWWDREMRSGEDFRAVIERELEASDCVVVLWSRHSVGSRFVLDEATYAHDEGKLLPVLIDDSSPALGFRAIHTTNLAGWQGGEATPDLTLLVRDIERHVPHKQQSVDADSVAAEPEDRDAEDLNLSIGNIIREMHNMRKAVDALGRRAAETIEGPGMIPGGLIQSWRDEVEDARRDFDKLREQAIGLRMTASEKARFLAGAKETDTAIRRVKQYVGRPL